MSSEIEIIQTDFGPRVSFFDFNSAAVRELLHNLKYNGIRDISDVFAKIAGDAYSASKITQIFPEDWVIIPVPTSNAKKKVRGYNQVEELAQSFSTWLDKPVTTNVLKRRSGKSSQVGKSAEERRKADLGFHCEKEFSGSVVLFDDVSTTGGTLQACAAVLRERGVNVIGALVVANTRSS